jgi:hypothetical protein
MVVVNIKSAAKCGGYILLFTPQPIHTAHPVVTFCPLAVGASVNIQLAPDRLSNTLHVWWVSTTPGRWFSRQGFGEFDLSAGGRKSCTLRHLGGVKINSVDFIVGIGTVSPVVRGPDRQVQYENLVEKHIAANKAFWADRTQVSVGVVGQWMGNGIALPGCIVPSWAFLLEYAHPASTVHNHQTLMRLLQVAQHRLCLSSEEIANPDSWSDALRSEIMCEMATTLARLGRYHSDTFTRPENMLDQLSSTMSALGLGSSRPKDAEIDQWIHPILFNSASDMEFDCEDGASTVYYVVRLLQTIKATSVKPKMLSAGVAAIAEFSKRYEFFFTTGVLYIASTKKCVFHAWVTAFDKRLAHAVMKKTPKKTKTYLPMLNLESTAYTTPTPGFESDRKSNGESPHCDLVHRYHRFSAGVNSNSKIPHDCTSSDKQYKCILSLVAPHLHQSGGPCEWAPVSKNTIGLPMKLADTFWHHDFIFKGVSNVHDDTMMAVRSLLTTQPRTRGLPRVMAHQPFRPIPSFDNNEFVLSVGGAREWATDQSRQDASHRCHKRGITIKWVPLTIAQGCDEMEIFTTI